MSEPKARLIEDWSDFTMARVRLMVRTSDDRWAMGDGTWQRFEEGAIAEGAGILLPREVVEAVAQAIAEWQGHVSHADTEARVLRESLEVERRRVDGVLGLLSAKAAGLRFEVDP